MKKLIVFFLAITLALFAIGAVIAESIGPPGEIVAVVAPDGYFAAAMAEMVNGTTLAGADLALRAALEALAETILIAAIAAVFFVVSKIILLMTRSDEGIIGYHARDQTAATG